MSDQPDYVERLPRRHLADIVTREWARTASSDRELTIIADGCADLVWQSDGALLVAGPNLGPVTREQPADVTIAGLRLRPGTVGAVLGYEVNELCNQLVPLSALWGRCADLVAEQLATTTSPTGHLSILAAMLHRRLDSVAIDTEVVETATELTHSSQPVGVLARQVGLGDRQLQRRFTRQVGYGPKTFQRVMRFRRAVEIHDRQVAAPPERRCGLAELALAAGYADQSHLTRECRRLTGLTPAMFLNVRQPEDPALVHDVGSVQDDGGDADGRGLMSA